MILTLLHVLMTHLVLHPSGAKTPSTPGTLMPKVSFELDAGMQRVLPLLMMIVLPLKVGLVVSTSIIHTVKSGI